MHLKHFLHSAWISQSGNVVLPMKILGRPPSSADVRGAGLPPCPPRGRPLAPVQHVRQPRLRLPRPLRLRDPHPSRTLLSSFPSTSRCPPGPGDDRQPARRGDSQAWAARLRQGRGLTGSSCRAALPQPVPEVLGTRQGRRKCADQMKE